MAASLSLHSRTFQDEANLSDYIWSNTASSIAQPDPKSSSKKASDPVEMKAKGYSPLVQRVCSEFDAALGKMLDDLTFYVSQNCDKGQSVTLNPLDLTADDSSAEPFDLAADNGQILAFAQQAVAESFGNMVTSIASKFIDVDAQGKKPSEMFAFMYKFTLFHSRLSAGIPSILGPVLPGHARPMPEPGEGVLCPLEIGDSLNR